MHPVTVSLRLEKIISGGQTGADRGGLSAAIRLGIAHGGWCPRGRRAEDGFVPARYRLRETESQAYHVRTRRNVEEADATLLVTRGRPIGGSALTARLARERAKPLLALDQETMALQPAAAVAAFRLWLTSHRVRV